MDAHVFIDNSNVFGGAQRAAHVLEPGALWMAVRIYYRNLFTLIERGLNPVTRVLAGSVPPGNDALWESARRCGYDTDLLRRVENFDGRLVEQGVDEIAHLKIGLPMFSWTTIHRRLWFSSQATDMTRTSARVSQSRSNVRCVEIGT